MKHKEWMRTTAVLFSLALSVGALSVLGACGEGSIIAKEVGTVEDLFAMKKNGSYRLTNDIDLQNAVWTPLSVKSLDGNGFTIKNCLVNGICTTSSAAFSTHTAFLGLADTVKNVTFENIAVTATDASHIAVVVGELSGSAENVTVKNCEINGIVKDGDCQTGVLCGYSIGKFSNCTVENCTFNCTVSGGSGSYLSAHYGFGFGGICGSMESRSSATNCTAIDCDITISVGAGTISNIGGLVGHAEGYAGREDRIALQGCAAIENELNIDTQAESERATRIGGIIGFNGNAGNNSDSGKLTNRIVARCKSYGNAFDVDAVYNYSLGGIAGRSDGKLENNLSDSNSLRASSSHNSITANIGGVCGSSTYGSIRSCIAQNCELYGTSGSGDNMHTCGLTGVCGASVSYCAVRNNFISGAGADIFMSQSNMIFFCYAYGDHVSNLNEIEILSDEEWMKIIDSLSLDKMIWEQVASGDLVLK